MNEYYQTLGIDPSASADEIKKAYRKLANQHHPDKGGDQDTFKNISVAYDTLGDVANRSQYDQQQQMQNNPFGQFNFNDFFGGGGHPFEQMFRQTHQRVYRNRDLNIQYTISFIDSYYGKQIEANFTLPSGKKETIAINVPPGIDNGMTIRYAGMGDDSIPNAPRGDLNVTIKVDPDELFKRVGDDIYKTIYVSSIEAMIGCSKKVEAITGEEMLIEIRPGILSGTEYARHGLGFTNVNTTRKGRFVTVVDIKPTIVKDPELVAKLKQLDIEINEKN